jgi:shikimate dehydrogenase
MGPAGMISRSHYRSFGCDWSYVAATRDATTAPGQLDLGQALDMNLPRSAGAPVYALVGGSQVVSSPGPRTYCALFKAFDIPSSYIPVIAEDLSAALPLLESLGARGLSVTMPFKRAAMDLAEPDALATEAGVANTLRYDDGVWHASNTDIRGVRVPLAEALSNVTRISGRATRALILGTGGAARAAAVACRQNDLDVIIAGRNLEAAEDIAAPQGRGIRWLDRSHCEHDILINATPLAGQDCPWPENANIDAQIVFDLAIGSESSRLLERAEARGAVTLDPTAMWLHQGAAQMRHFLQRAIDVEHLQQAMTQATRLDREDRRD